MDFLPPTAPSLVFARETYTPYTITATMCRSNLNEVINHATNVDERYGIPKRSETVITLNQYP